MKTSPITSSTFLRYFQETETGEETNEKYISLDDLDYSGVPIDAETGDDLDATDLFIRKEAINLCK